MGERCHMSASGSILLKKDFERGLRATLIQGEGRTSNIDSKLHLLGFDCFNLIPQLHFGDFFNAIGQNAKNSE